MRDEELDDLLFALSPCRQLTLNFMKSVSLLSAAQYLEANDRSPESIKTADAIIDDIVEGYQMEEHSIQ